jgi:hypothetical protein
VTTSIVWGQKIKFSRHARYLTELEIEGVIRTDNGICKIRNELYLTAINLWLSENNQDSTEETKLMPGIPTEINKPLRKVLIECGPFDTEGALTALFAHEWLYPWRYNVPHANSPMGRVDETINFLHNKHRSDGSNALVLLLKIISDRLDPADECYHRVIDITNKLQLAFGVSSSLGQLTPESHTPGSPMTYVASDARLLACAKAVGMVSMARFTQGKMEHIISGTGWLITSDLVLTCWHVLEGRTYYDAPISEADLYEQIENSLVIFDHTQADQRLEYGVHNLEHFSKTLDYALIRLRDRVDYPLSERGFLQPESDPPLTAQTQLFVIQHPKGQIQQHSAGYYVKISPDGHRIFHNAPSESGTSGAPVLNVANWRLVALHRGENKAERLREGVLIKAILDDLNLHKPQIYAEIATVQRTKE